MNSFTSSSTETGRCGMCGACGSMPPWAPEMLKDTPPEARRALEKRMREAQMRFIEERDAKMAALKSVATEDARPEPDSTPPNSPPAQDAREITHNIRDLQLNPDDQIPTGAYQLEGKTISLIDEEERDQKPDLPERPMSHRLGASEELFLESFDDISSHNSTTDGEELEQVEIPLDSASTANHIVPLDSPIMTPLPSLEPESLPTETSPLPPDEYHSIELPPRSLPILSSPALQESLSQPETPVHQTLPDMSLEPNQITGTLRTVSLRSVDSDADSFHTADGDELLRRSTDGLSLKEADVVSDVAPVITEIEWQAFQSEEDILPNARPFEQTTSFPEGNKPTQKEEPVDARESDKTNAEPSLPYSSSLHSQASENLEDTVVTSRKPLRGPSSPQAQQDALMDDYALPSDLVGPNQIDLEPQPCEDCERWRGRVRELELKVEALSSALSAREMESASMRARAVDRRHHGKTEAQLVQECESLRVTTEYLYYKLERYESKVNGSHPDVH